MSKEKIVTVVIMKCTEVEQKTKEFYERLWSDPSKIKRSGQDLFLGWHYGFYEKGIKNIKEAMIQMNEYLARLLELNNETGMTILDAGSGVGYTSIYLAKKYPKCLFYGITLTNNELKIAESVKKEHGVENVRFQQKSYLNSGFPTYHFDRIFALESSIYAPNKKEFLQEMHRLLTPNGKLVIIDTFLKKYILNSLTVNAYNYIHQRKCTQQYLANYYASIDTFTTYLESLQFENINVNDIVRSGNVKRHHIYCFLILRLFPYLAANLGQERKKRNSWSYKIIYPFAFFSFFLYRSLLIFYSKPNYYSIEARKK